MLKCEYANREMSTPYRRTDKELVIGKARFLEDVWNIPAEDIRREEIRLDKIRREAEAAREAAAAAQAAAAMQP